MEQEASRVSEGATGYVIGIDVGGTFTDAICSNGTETWRAKAPTNPSRFRDGVIECCGLLAGHIGLSASELLARTARFGLGTTAVTNVIATRKGRTVGLITTAGFENHLHSMRNHRQVVDGWLTMNWNPVDRHAVRGIDERIDRQGAVRRNLDLSEVAEAAKQLVETRGVNAFAVSFLWSVRNPAHEQAAAGLIRQLYPDCPVFSGVELHPVVREFERTTLAVLNAFAADALDGVDELQLELAELGMRVPLLLLHSGGGAISAAEARATPLGLASSGPAAGAVAASEVASAIGRPNALCCDMGGTSIDVAVIIDGVPQRCQSAEIGGMITGQSAIDVESIGAGGGSIAWIDSRNLLRVGPQSARATPGPVCYGRGGTEPTVTDANLLLGFIDADGFMGGAMPLNVSAAREACARLGDRIGLTAMEIAHGIREIALAEMAQAMRARISSSGIDTRRYGVIAYGGSGSLFAAAMARDLGLPWVAMPAAASVLSAYGAASADVRVEAAQAIDALLPHASAHASEVLAVLQVKVDEALGRQGVAPHERSILTEVDLRLPRQRASLTLALEDGDLNPELLLQRFRALYAQHYGGDSLMSQTPVELALVRAIGVGQTLRAVLPRESDVGMGADTITVVGHRDIFLEPDAPQRVPVHDFNRIMPHHDLRGPLLIDTGDTTLWAPAGSITRMGPGRTLICQFEEPICG